MSVPKCHDAAASGVALLPSRPTPAPLMKACVDTGILPSQKADSCGGAKRIFSTDIFPKQSFGENFTVK